MSKKAFTEYYKGGCHAVRSACEQGAQAAEMAEAKFTDTTLKQLAAEGAAMSDRHQEAFVEFLKDVGEEPNGFQDLMMKGVNDGTEEALKQASETVIVDVALVNGAQAGLHYFITGFGTHATVANALGLSEHGAKLSQMIDEAKDLDQRYTAASAKVISEAAIA